MLRLASSSLFLLLVVAACSSSSSSSSSSGTPAATAPLVHRAAVPASCPADRGPGQAPDPPGSGSQCAKDSDCTTGKNGRCTLGPDLGTNGEKAFVCTYDDCATDADCGAGKLCDCRPDDRSAKPNSCVAAQCTKDADCGASGFCSPSKPPEDAAGTFLTGYACHTAADECVNDADCATQGTATCSFDTTAKHWRCAVFR